MPHAHAVHHSCFEWSFTFATFARLNQITIEVTTTAYRKLAPSKKTGTENEMSEMISRDILPHLTMYELVHCATMAVSSTHANYYWDRINEGIRWPERQVFRIICPFFVCQTHSASMWSGEWIDKCPSYFELLPIKFQFAQLLYTFAGPMYLSAQHRSILLSSPVLFVARSSYRSAAFGLILTATYETTAVRLQNIQTAHMKC